MRWESIILSAVAALPFAAGQDSVSFDKDSYGQDDPEGSPFQTFMSNENVKPPQLHINSNRSGLAEGYVFIGVDGEPTSGQNWPTIWDMSGERMGTLVWTANYTEPFDFRTQTYKGEPVLTFWAGELLGGHGHGSFYILNQSYCEIVHFHAVGYEGKADLHEFLITSNDTALVMIYTPKPFDLSAIGGPEDGWILENVLQEINIETGDLVFEWNASTHVGLNETYEFLGDAGDEDNPFDYFHMNSIDKDQNGDYLISARLMICIYKIGGDGNIIWRLGGKQSDFELTDNAVFAFQHDARWIDEDQTRMAIFDNGPTNATNHSRGLLFAVDQDEMTASVIHEFYNAEKTFGQFEGGLQAIDPGNESTNYMLSYGSEPYFAEFDKDASLLLDAQFGSTNVVNSYRAYKQKWQGKPLTKPDIHWDKDGNKAYFSWNGATDVEQWAIYTANATNGSTWYPAASANRTGFETTVNLSNVTLDTYIRALALNSSGDALDWTQASNGNELFDASGDVSENAVSSSTTSTTPQSASASPTATAPEVTETGAAVKLGQGMVEKVFIAIVAVGGVALV